MIDIGANLADPSFDGDRDRVLERALAAGVRQLLVTGSSVARSAHALEVARGRPGVLFATGGIHPHEASTCDDPAIDALRRLCAAPEVVAVGECGLDFYRDLSPRSVQELCLRRQLELAAELRLPVFLHDRDASAAMLPIVSSWRPRLSGGVVHCFTGEASALERYLDLDLHIGITGWICDERRGLLLRELVGRIPDDRLLIETDAPYLLPRTLRPRPRTRRNEPQWLAAVRDEVAACRGQDPEHVAAVTTVNARRLFGLPEPA